MRVSFFTRVDLKEVMCHQYFNEHCMIHSEEIWYHKINKSIKERGQCTRSNKINGDFGKIAKEQDICRSYRPLPYVENIVPN